MHYLNVETKNVGITKARCLVWLSFEYFNKFNPLLYQLKLPYVQLRYGYEQILLSL